MSRNFEINLPGNVRFKISLVWSDVCDVAPSCQHQISRRFRFFNWGLKNYRSCPDTCASNRNSVSLSILVSRVFFEDFCYPKPGILATLSAAVFSSTRFLRGSGDFGRFATETVSSNTASMAGNLDLPDFVWTPCINNYCVFKLITVYHKHPISPVSILFGIFFFL